MKYTIKTMAVLVALGLAVTGVNGFAESGAHDAGVLKFEILTQRRGDAEREHTDLLTPNGVRESDNVSRVSGEQIRLSNQEDSVPPRRGVGNNSATVWASSLDGQPLASSSRILVTHLTDVQNSGVRYRDPELTILEDWGGLPHLARNGAADLSLAVADGDWMAWRLDTCFDVNVVRDGPAPWTMYFSWRPRKAIALVRSEDGFAWTQEPEICLEANPASGWEDNINRSCTVFKDGLRKCYEYVLSVR